MRKTIDKIRRFLRPGHERGMALVIALMLLSVLSLLGASALLTTNIEVKISGNTRVGRMAFFAADGAGQAAGGVLEDCMVDVGWPNNYAYGGGVTVGDGDFPFETQGQDDDGDGNATNDLINSPDVTFAEPMAATVDVDKGPTVPVAGSSGVTAAGYEGTGRGAAGGGLKTVFDIRARGTAGNRAMSLVYLSYDHYI